jgi:hypothetical protein
MMLLLLLRVSAMQVRCVETPWSTALELQQQPRLVRRLLHCPWKHQLRTCPLSMVRPRCSG